MKLFLSSLRLPNKDEQNKLFGGKTSPTVVIIPNAWDPYPEKRQQTELANTKDEFEKRGYRPSVLDLVTSSDAQRQDALQSNDLAWVMGGNSFYLNYLIRKTGFDVLLKDVLREGLVYGGVSAGAVIAGPTLYGTENVDDPHDAPRVVWDGLGLVDFGVVPHWGMEKYAGKLEKMADEMRQLVPQCITLTNEQAITVLDDTYEIA